MGEAGYSIKTVWYFSEHGKEEECGLAEGLVRPYIADPSKTTPTLSCALALSRVRTGGRQGDVSESEKKACASIALVKMQEEC